MSTADQAKRRPREINRADTRNRLLDAAESLFAERGYFGVSVRDITQQAGTRLAAISDQFGGKEGLFRAVLLRRIQPLNDDRRTRLQALSRRGSRAQRVRALIDAFADPMRERVGDPGWRNYFRFIAQFANSGDPIQLLVADEFNSMARDFITELHLLFPEADDTAIHDAYLHLVAATLHTYSNNRRLDSLTHGREHTSMIDERHHALLRFAEGGITQLAHSTTPTPPSASRGPRHRTK